MKEISNALVVAMPRMAALEMAYRAKSDARILGELLSFAVEDAGVRSRKAAWVLGHVFIQDISLLTMYAEPVITLLSSTADQSIRRELIKPFLKLSMNEDQQGRLIDMCFSWLGDPQQSMAVHYNAFRVAEKITRTWPELRGELVSHLEILQDSSVSPIREHVPELLNRLAKRPSQKGVKKR